MILPMAQIMAKPEIAKVKEKGSGTDRAKRVQVTIKGDG